MDPKSRAKPRPGASGFDYLTAVERATPGEGLFSVDWAVPDTWKVHPAPRDIHLRLPMLSQVDEAAFADGVPPQNRGGEPGTVRDFTRELAESTTIEIGLDLPWPAYGCDPATLAGRSVYVDDTGQPRNAAYMITLGDARRSVDGPRSCWVWVFGPWNASGCLGNLGWAVQRGAA